MRWMASISYRTDHGTTTSFVDVEEIGDLQDIIEAGPHWDTVISISIVRINHCSSRTLTIEQAEYLL